MRTMFERLRKWSKSATKGPWITGYIPVDAGDTLPGVNCSDKWYSIGPAVSMDKAISDAILISMMKRSIGTTAKISSIRKLAR